MTPLQPALRWHVRLRSASALRGLLLMVASTLCVACMHASIRLVPGHMHAFEKAFFRNFIGLLLFLPWVLRSGGTVLRTRHPGLHLLRGVLNAASMLSFFVGVQMTHLAAVAAIGFTSPLIAIALASLWMKERVHPRRWIVLGCGFLGLMVLVRPGRATIEPGILYLLAAAATWALALLVIKRLARSDGSLTIATYQTSMLAPLTLLAALPHWQWPTWPQLAVLAGISALGNLGQVTLSQALREADASAVLPLDFLRILWNSVLGYVIFMEVPTVWTWIGGTIIFASTTWLTLRESRPARG